MRRSCAPRGRRVQDALTRVGGVSLELPQVLGAENPLRYRNKVQFPVAQEKRGLAVGYYRARSHDVLDVDDCLLQPETVTTLRRAFKGWMERYRVPAYDEGTCQGLIRHLYVRTNQAGEALCCVVANGTRLPHAPELVQALRQAAPALAGLVLNTNTKDTNVILGPNYRIIWGRDFLEERLCGMTFRLSVPSFFQINRAQTERLYAQALEFAGLTGRGDSAGPVLRHRDHLPGPGPAGRAGDRGGDRPRGRAGRPGQCRPQPGAKRPVPVRRRGGGRLPAGRRGGSAPRSSAWTRPGRGWPRRCRRSWSPWRRSASSTSPATRPPWPGT